MGCVLTSLKRASAVSFELIALVFALALLVPALLGYSRYVITGDSMAGTFERGSIVYSHEVPVPELEVGDVITFVPPRKQGLVTHRITGINENRRRIPVFQTKGDANEAPDPLPFKLDSDVQSRVAFSIPYIGYPIAALSIREVRIGLIGLPALLIGLALVMRLWRDSAPPAPTRTPAPGAGP